jgi:hypothetical protein
MKIPDLPDGKMPDARWGSNEISVPTNSVK